MVQIKTYSHYINKSHRNKQLARYLPKPEVIGLIYNSTVPCQKLVKYKIKIDLLTKISHRY